MKLIKVPNDPEIGYSNVLHSTNHIVEMGVYRVMYGHRVRAGFCSDRSCCVLDWCGGGRWEDVERLYSLLYSILNARPENKHCFDGLPPHSMVKPFFLDLDFVKVVVAAAETDFQLIHLEV